ncbi:unnamed protein product [Ranitomeya imitator]|uniref:Uncharacterized protein n=1 Tax=Ranitomeya imitator TaxID=111125 RepID=A0ABN9LWQ5_9NEOB|nr:unnamed protein product [Ranitomeya imitator]
MKQVLPEEAVHCARPAAHCRLSALRRRREGGHRAGRGEQKFTTCRSWNVPSATRSSTTRCPPGCIKMGKAEAVIDTEIPNCWECPRCVREGRTCKRRSRAVETHRRPAPREKKPPDENQGHKRKKDPVQEVGVKKKVKAEKDKKIKKEPQAPSEPVQMTDRSHQREKIERFKQMCQMLERCAQQHIQLQLRLRF